MCSSKTHESSDTINFVSPAIVNVHHPSNDRRCWVAANNHGPGCVTPGEQKVLSREEIDNMTT